MDSEIANFYKGQSVFITGATGFLGKVLIEKLLRSCGELKHIYVLLRSKKGEDVNTRLNNLLRAKIFEKLFDCEPQTMSKVTAIEGDITLPGLGISEERLETLVRDVSVVFHSAATVRFDEPLRTAVNYNVLATRRVIELCHKLPKLLALIHVSTAYSNCNRHEIDEKVYPSPVPPQSVIDMCEANNISDIDAIIPQLMEGYPNTYTYTKGLAETLLIEECGDLPVAIVRPSIVTPSWKEPMPGWVDSLAGITGYVVAAGKGVFRHALHKSDARADLIPVDTVINLMISLVWFTATHRPNDIKVYNCTSGSLNPFTWGQVVEKLSPPHSIASPSSKLYRYPSLNGTESKFIFKMYTLFDHIIPAYLYDGLMYLMGRKRFMVDVYDKIHRSFRLMVWFGTRDFEFSNNNVLMLDQELKGVDRDIFSFDIRLMDWSKYWADFYLGTRQFILKESNEALPEAKKNLRKVYFRDLGIAVLFIVFFVFSILSILA